MDLFFHRTFDQNTVQHILGNAALTSNMPHQHQNYAEKRFCAKSDILKTGSKSHPPNAPIFHWELKLKPRMTGLHLG